MMPALATDRKDRLRMQCGRSSVARTRALCARMDGVLRTCLSIETVRKLGSVDPETHSLLLLEALATCSHAYPGTYRDACAP
jgi:hypothetical protein